MIFSLSNKYMTASMTALLFSIGLSWFNHISLTQMQKEPSSSFFIDLIFTFMISLLVIFFGGIPVSIVADMIVAKFKSIYTQYFAAILLYGIGNLVVNVFFITALITDFNLNARSLMIYGLVAALLFFHISLLINYFAVKYTWSFVLFDE